MRLRPHHLLCTQSYEGKGYSHDFVENMNTITTHLRSNPDTEIKITSTTDDICQKCPRMLGENQCVTNEKITRMDGKVMEYFGVEETTYNYHNITQEIRNKITDDILYDICGQCEWYPISACRAVLLSEGYASS